MAVKNPLTLLCFSLVLLPFSSGCAALAISAAGAGAGIGIPYVFSDCADRTLNFSYDQVERATPQVLNKLDMALIAETEVVNGKRIKASASNLDITIEVEKITLRATRVTINAKKGSLIKDKATAEEILNQLEKTLTPEQFPYVEKSSQKEKRLPVEKSNFLKESNRAGGPSFVGF